MCKNKKNAGMIIGAAILGCGVAAGAYLAKKYYDKRKQLLKNYDVEVDRLQNEVDFDYSEEFLKELKKETLNADKKQLSREDLLRVLNDIKNNSNEQIKKLETVLREHLKREEAFTEEVMEIVIEGDEPAATNVPTENVEDACFNLEAEAVQEDATQEESAPAEATEE